MHSSILENSFLASLITGLLGLLGTFLKLWLKERKRRLALIDRSLELEELRRYLKAWLNVFKKMAQEQLVLLAEVALKKEELMRLINTLMSEIAALQNELECLKWALLSRESERQKLLMREQELSKHLALKVLELKNIIINLIQWNAQWDQKYRLLLHNWGSRR